MSLSNNTPIAETSTPPAGDVSSKPGGEIGEKARLALRYVLARIADNPELAWRFIGTESYAKMIDAYSSLAALDAKGVEERYKPKDSYCCRTCQRAEEEGRAK